MTCENFYTIADEGGNNIILQKLILSVPDRPDLELDLKGRSYSACILYFRALGNSYCVGAFFMLGDLSKFKKTPFVIKEGCTYQIKIQFRVSEPVCE